MHRALMATSPHPHAAALLLLLMSGCRCQAPADSQRPADSPSDSPGESPPDSPMDDTDAPPVDGSVTPQTHIGAAGLYGLLSVDETTDSETGAQFLAHDDYAGVSVRSTWSTLEPSEGTFDWRAFDDWFAEARDHDKRVILRVKAGWCTPDWVYEAGAEAFWYDEDQNGGERSRMPVPWDAVFQAKWSTFLAELGARYGEEPSVAMVIITGASRSTEMYLPNTEVDQQQWAKQGYEPEALVAAWQWVIGQYATHLPHKPWALGLSKPLYDDGVTEAVVAWAVAEHPWQFVAKINYWQDDNDEAYFPTAALLSVTDEATHGGLEPVGWFGEGRPAGDVEAAMNAAIRWHTVLWNEPYIGNIDEHGRLAEEIERHRAMVASSGLDLHTSNDGAVELSWTLPSGYEGFEQVLLLAADGACPDGANDDNAIELHRGSATSHSDEAAPADADRCYALYELPSEYTLGQRWHRTP
jgi:hypothetical protein